MSYPTATTALTRTETKSRRILKRSAKVCGYTLLTALVVAIVYYSIQTHRSKSAFLELSQAAIVPGHDIPWAGQWTGRWTSQGVGDGGELKAILTYDASKAQWRAQFFADHYAIFQTNEELLLEPKQTAPGQWTFEGTAHLAEGDHLYTGKFNGVELTMNWKSATDYGILSLTKPPYAVVVNPEP